MAEYHEIIRLKDRICKSTKTCFGCPISKYRNGKDCSCGDLILSYPDFAEKIIMEWAAKNPESKYPTWVEWWDKNFKGEGRRMLSPCSFVSPKELGCSIEHDGCMNAPFKCWHKPIPAHIAEKLGIQPLGHER